MKHELEKPRTAKEMCQVLTHNWQSGSSVGLISHKTPTSLLLNKDGTFDSFGYDAERTYFRLAERNEHKDWKFFRKFKMMLHKNKVCVIEFYQLINFFSVSVCLYFRFFCFVLFCFLLFFYYCVSCILLLLLLFFL